MQNELVETPKVFDLRTHIKDQKTGETIKVNHYKMEVSKADGTRYERPIGSGNFYDGAGKLLIKGKDPVIEKTKEEIRNDLEKEKQILASENEKLKAQIEAMMAKEKPVAAPQGVSGKAEGITGK